MLTLLGGWCNGAAIAGGINPSKFNPAHIAPLVCFHPSLFRPSPALLVVAISMFFLALLPRLTAGCPLACSSSVWQEVNRSRQESSIGFHTSAKIWVHATPMLYTTGTPKCHGSGAHARSGPAMAIDAPEAENWMALWLKSSFSSYWEPRVPIGKVQNPILESFHLQHTTQYFQVAVYLKNRVEQQVHPTFFSINTGAELDRRVRSHSFPLLVAISLCRAR